jgi:hypothetical protein
MRLVQGDLFNVLLEVRELDPKKVNFNALARRGQPRIPGLVFRTFEFEQAEILQVAQPL